MICQNCNKREASIQLNVQTNNQKSQYRLCHTCYQALMKEHKIPSGFGGGGFMNIDDLFNQMAQEQAAPEQPQQGNGGSGFLDQFGRNLTQIAKTGLIDPVIG
ncbi:MAG: ATP-dependent Clp protease ATP-binding subunit, partial [Priestia megaterium]